MRMDIFEGLNPNQKEAVKTIDGPLLLLAGAGSGKTRVLIHRMAYMVQNGVRPFNILAITFTNKAAREMKERAGALIDNASDIWLGTFHSMCVRILRREIDKIGYDGKFTIYDMDDSQRVMKQLLKEHNINDKLLPAKTALGVIGRQKDYLVTPQEYADSVSGDYSKKQVAELYEAYQKRLRTNNALDFDDLIVKTVELFTAKPEVLDKYQNRFRYICVDEYQDTNYGQYRLVQMLGKKNRNVCVVGDDDQSIYGWRGADIRNILEFEKDFPGAKVLRLEQNYRSTKTILEAANNVIGNNKRRKGKELWTQNEQGAPIFHYRAATHLEEADYVIDEIKTGQAKGAAYSDYAILYRMNALSRPFEDRLVRENVPYKVFGGVRFYERMEVKDVLAYLKSIYNPLDDVSLKRIVNVPRRGIGDETVSRLEAYAADMDVPFYDALESADEIHGLPYKGTKVKAFAELLKELRAYAEDQPVTEVLREIFERTGYVNELLAVEPDRDIGMERVANVMELAGKAEEYVKQAEAEGLETGVAAFLEEVALVADVDGYSEGQNVVVLMTMHSAKGLEFNSVFVVGFEEGVFPGTRTIFSPDINDMEEERRVCYVAITRAKKTLYLTNAASRKMFNDIVYNQPSRFMKEIPEGLLHAIKPLRSLASSHGSMGEPARTGDKPRFAYDGSLRSKVDLPKPKIGPPDYMVGDYINQKKYGRGKVVEIKNAGADYEVTVDFPVVGRKKFMAHLSNLVRTV